MLTRLPAPPSRAVALTVSATLLVVWVFVRLIAFDTVMFPLTYIIPLLVCVWTRDRVALWAMAATFLAVHVVKVARILPADMLTSGEVTANLLATFGNVIVGAVVIDSTIRILFRLEAAQRQLLAQTDELRAQREELAQQNEELTEQAEELTAQGEELSAQNEELQSLTEEVGTLNESLTRRERLLETLLDTAAAAGGERAALRQTVHAGPGLFPDVCSAAAVYQKTPSGLQLHTASSAAPHEITPSGQEDAFAALVLAQNRIAAIDDVTRRPDLAVPVFPGAPTVRSALAAPIHIGHEPTGVLAIYCDRPHGWTQEEFRLAGWLAAQCGHVLDALRVQADLREANRRKGEFLATLSHELRNPLAPIRFAVKLLEQDRHHPSALPIVQRQLQQLVRLVDDLLDATRLSSNKIQLRKSRADLMAVVQHAIEAARPHLDTARHQLSVDMPREALWLDMDADRMSQVLTNLLNNAARYTPPGGRVSVSVRRDDGRAIVAVSDTGIGVSADDRGRLFEMFAQAGGPGSGGLGIGLALVRGIVELHGGQVDVHSDGIGHGSEFRVTLPLPATAADAPASAGNTPAVAPSPRRVLVVDDNVDAAAMMDAVLRLNGHAVWVASDAEAAIATAASVAPEVALLDIGLPGMDGYELARRLRHRSPSLRLVAVTGWGQDEDRGRARAAGFDAHFTKPAEPETILAALVDPSLSTRSEASAD